MENLKEVLLNIDLKELKDRLEDIHPVDFLDYLRNIENKEEILERLPDEYISSLFDDADDDEKKELLQFIPKNRANNIIGDMYSDELADLIRTLDKPSAKEILDNLDEESKEDVKEILSYPESTAGSIMATEFCSLKENMTVNETLAYMQKTSPDATTGYYLYVLDRNSKLKGVLSLRDLVVNLFNVKIKDIMNENVKYVPALMDQEEVSRLFKKYGYLTLPVVDENNIMIGIITVDDIIDVIEEEATEDIHRLGGVQEGEKIDDAFSTSYKNRFPWLFVNLLTAFLAASVVGVFEGTISIIPILATFMPVVAGMGGNAGTQTLTLVVRGIALGELNKENGIKILAKELIVGVLTGASIGLVTALVAALWSKNYMFGVVIGLAMIGNMAMATTSGFLIPVVLKKLKVDPALASAVFVTTVTDVLGFFFFLGLATLFMKLLM